MSPRPTDARLERETTITISDADGVARIYTAQPTMMRRLRKNPLATLIETHRDARGRTTGMEFELPKRAISIRTRLPKGHVPSSASLAAIGVRIFGPGAAKSIKKDAPGDSRRADREDEGRGPEEADDLEFHREEGNAPGPTRVTRRASVPGNVPARGTSVL